MSVLSSSACLVLLCVLARVCVCVCVCAMQSDSESSDERVPSEEFASSELVGIEMMGWREFTIKAKFIQEVEGARFAKLDVRKSRGICQLLTARVEKRMSAIEKRRLFGIAEGAVNVLETLRNKRDVSIKAVALAGGTTPARGFQPRKIPRHTHVLSGRPIGLKRHASRCKTASRPSQRRPSSSVWP